MRACLTADDFQTLVSGGVVKLHGDDVELILSDIGYDMMHRLVEKARYGINIHALAEQIVTKMQEDGMELWQFNELYDEMETGLAAPADAKDAVQVYVEAMYET